MSLTSKQKKVVDWIVSHVRDHIASKAIEALLALFIEQDQKLERIAHDVNKIKGQKCRSGFKYLEDAMNVAAEKLRIDLINDARRAFTEATELEDAPRASGAAYQVGLCYKMLGESATALRWYEKAFSIADSAWDASHKKLYSLVDTGDTEDFRAVGLVILAATTVGAPLSLYIEYRIFKEKKRLEEELRELDQSIPHLITHLRGLNSKLPALEECAKKHVHGPRDEYRSFGDGNSWPSYGPR